MKLRSLAVALLAATALFATFAYRVEAAEIRLAKQFSMGYLQFNVMEHEKLIEKHAKALGVNDLQVTWATFNGPSSMNDALLSNSVDVVSGGVPGLLTLWDRTRGTPQEVRGISALSSQPFLLNTRNPQVKTIADFTAADKIALPSVKVSVQAVMLEMAAAKRWGAENYAKLDPLTVSMSPPDATLALMNARDVTAAFSVPPYQYEQLENPQIHTVLNSYDVMGSPHTFTVAWTTARFHDANPVLYKALYAALVEATAIVNKNKRQAAQYWLDDTSSKIPLENVHKIVSGPQVKWTMAPENLMKFANFMHSVGSLKTLPSGWHEVFFPEVRGLRGS